jgi:hypothetical protein
MLACGGEPNDSAASSARTSSDRLFIFYLLRKGDTPGCTTQPLYKISPKDTVPKALKALGPMPGMG